MPKPLAVLNIEDSESDSKLIASLLKKAGYKITFERVETEAQMRAALKKRAWDLVISVHSLPQFDSFAALALLHEEGLDIPFIAVSGAIGEEAVVAMLKAGAHDFLVKDNLTRLIPAVERELEYAKVRRERKQAQDELLESEFRFRQVWETTSDAMALSDSEGIVLAVNPAYLDLYGYPPEQGVGHSFSIIFPQENRSWAVEQYKNTFASEVIPSIFEAVINRADGTQRIVESKATFIMKAGARVARLSTIRDITERKQADDALRTSEKRFRALIENSLDDISLLTADGTLIWESPSVIRHLDYAPNEFLGRNIFELMHPDDLQQNQNLFTELVQKPASRKSGVFRLKHRDGTWHWMEAVATNMLDEARVQALVINYRDITERKKMEAVLLLSEHAYRSLFKNVPVGLYRTTADGRMLDANPALVRMFGYQDRESLLAVKVENLYADPASKKFNDERIKSDIITSLEAEFCKKDGTTFWAEDRVQIARDENGNALFYEGSLIEITERKQAKEALQKSEKRYQDLVRVSPVGIFRTDEHGYTTFVNQKWCELSGLSFNEALGNGWLNAVHPQDRENLSKDWEAANVHAQPSVTDYRFLRPDGKIIWVMGQATPETNSENQVVGYIGTVTDITGRKQVEESLHESEERFRSLFNSMMDGVYRSKHEGKFVDVNPAMVKMFGYSSREEMLAVDIKNELYFEPQERGSHILDTGQEEMDVYRMRRKDGSEIWVEDHGSYVHDEQGRIIYHEGILRDITGRKQAEQALIKSEALYRQAIEVAGAVPYYESYYDNYEKIKYDFIGEGIRQITGYGPEEFTGTQWDTMVLDAHPLKELSAYSLEEAIRLVRSGAFSIWQCEYRIRHRDGGIRWVFEAAIELRDEHGRAHGSIGTYQDITERKQTEAAAREDEARYRSLFEDSPVSLWEEDFSAVKLRLDALRDEGIQDFRAYFASHPQVVLEYISLVKIVDVNKATLKLFGAKEKADLLQSLTRLIDHDSADSFQHELINIAQGKSHFEWEGINQTLDGRQIVVRLNLSAMPGYEDTMSKVIISMVDITAHIHAEKTIRESEKYLRESQMIAGLGSYTLDVPSGKWTSSDILNQIFGIDESYTHSNDSYTRSVESWLSLIHPDWRQEMSDYFANEVMGNHIRFDKEYKIVRNNDGVERWVYGLGELEFNTQNQPVKMRGVIQDITERKQAEELLRESEQRYRALFEAMPVSIWEEDFSDVKKHLDALKEQGITDFRTYFESNPDAVLECNAMIKVLNINLATLKMYRADSKEDLFKSVAEVPNERMMEQIRDVLIAISEERNNYTWEGADETIAGEPIQINLSWSVVPGHEIDFSKVIVTTIDITQRKQAEEAQSRSEQRYRALFEDMPVSIWEEDFSDAKKYLDSLREQGVTDFRTYFKTNPQILLACGTMLKVLDVNRATLKMYRAGSKEDLYKNMDEGLSESEVEHMSDALIAIAEGKISHRWEGADETIAGEPIEISLNWTVAPGHEADFSRVIVTTIDITERGLAEKALRASEAQFRAIFEGAAIGIALVEPSGHPMKINSALVEMLGYDAQELCNMVFTDFTHPDDVALDWNLWQELMAGLRDHYQIEKRFIHRNGHIIWAKLTSSIVPDADGKILFGVGMVEDISERKKAEAEIKYQLSELEALYENGLAISSLLEPKRIAQKLVEVIDQKLDWHHAAIRLYDTYTDHLELLALNSPGFNEAQISEQIERINQTINTPDKGLSGWVIKHGEVVRVGKLKDDPRYIETYAGIASGLYVPIKNGDRTIGSIAVESEQENAFTERDANTLTTLANQAAISFINARLYSWLQKELDERHRAEEEVRKLNFELEQRVAERTAQIEVTKRRLELATHAGQIGVWEYNPRENKVIWDERMYMIHQIPAGEFGGTWEAWAQLIHPDDLEKSHINKQLAFTQNLLLNNEHRIVLPDGSIRHINTSAVTVFAEDGAPDRVIGISIDNTERKHTEQSLRESENYARLLFDAVADPVSVTEGDALIVDVNEAFEKQYNLMRDEIRGKRITELGIYPETELNKRQKYLSEVLQGRPVEPVELDFYVPADRPHTLELNSYLLTVNGRQLVLNTAHDITSHKKAQEAQRLAKSEIEHALRIKNEFLANMSHELRTPLNSILGISESLEEQIAGALNEKQLKYIGIVRESGSHLLELINDILDLSKIEAGRMELDIHKISVEMLCQSSLRMIKELSQKKSLHVSFNVKGDLKIILADQRRIKQSLVNLLSNAVKFTPPGKEIGLEVSGNTDTNEVEFAVWDQGVGITQENIKLLFKPFVQLDASLAREYQGTGLGLALVAQMVHLHGGHVRVESEVGKGSRFIITLPWSPNEQTPKAKVTGKLSFPSQRSDEKRNGRILLVEDTDVVVQLISEYLRYKGYEMILAHNGVEAIKLAAQELPDLILMDVMMPIMDGLEATRRIRADETLRNIPIIALTALAMSGDSERCLEAGMNDYLSKPLQMQNLADMIEKYLGRTQEESNEQ